MKELSMEQNTKAYDEALERAKSEYQSHESFNGFCEMLTRIFPELREEEYNEKISAMLIRHIRQERGSLSNDEAAEAIAWLEKQDCQKSVDKEYTFKSLPRLLYMIKPTDMAKSYCKELIDSLQTEGYSIDAKMVGECLNQMMNGEEVAMPVMDIKKQEQQWKPSDEEIDALEEAMYQVGILTPLGSKINDLYEDLKKLKEE